jgi:hypothetical protein
MDVYVNGELQAEGTQCWQKEGSGTGEFDVRVRVYGLNETAQQGAYDLQFPTFTYNCPTNSLGS